MVGAALAAEAIGARPATELGMSSRFGSSGQGFQTLLELPTRPYFIQNQQTNLNIALPHS